MKEEEKVEAEKKAIDQYLQVVKNIITNDGEANFQQTIRQKGNHPVLAKAFNEIIPNHELKP